MDKKKIVFIAISVFVCLLVYLPTPKKIDPQEYNPPQPVNLDQLEIPKNKLDKAVYINTPFAGAEDVEFDAQGNIYSGLHDGSIIKINPDNWELKTIAKSQGPIFGIDINSKGDKLVLADQVSGIKLIDLKTGQMQPVVSQYKGVKFASPNSVVFGQNDQVLYFTVSSQSIPMSEFHEMLLYSEGSGKIFAFDLRTKQIQLLADGLYFANGLEYSPKDQCLFYVQTGRSRLSRLQLKPEKRGNTTLITDNILGYPDNVKLTESGDLWVAVPALRDSFTNIIDNNSLIRRVIINMRVPLSMFLAIANMKYAGGIKVNPKTGAVVDYFFGSSDHIDCISGINQNRGRLYLSSLARNKIAVVDLNNNTIKVPETSPVKQQTETISEPITENIQPSPNQIKQQAKAQPQVKEEVKEQVKAQLKEAQQSIERIEQTETKKQIKEQVKKVVKQLEEDENFDQVNNDVDVDRSSGEIGEPVSDPNQEAYEKSYQESHKQDPKPVQQNDQSTLNVAPKPKPSVKPQSVTTNTANNQEKPKPKAQPQSQTTTTTKPKAGQQNQQRTAQMPKTASKGSTSQQQGRAQQGGASSHAHSHGHSSQPRGQPKGRARANQL